MDINISPWETNFEKTDRGIFATYSILGEGEETQLGTISLEVLTGFYHKVRYTYYFPKKPDIQIKGIAANAESAILENIACYLGSDTPNYEIDFMDPTEKRNIQASKFLSSITPEKTWKNTMRKILRRDEKYGLIQYIDALNAYIQNKEEENTPIDVNFLKK